MKIILTFLTILCFSGGFSQEKSFSSEALQDILMTANGSQVTFDTVLKDHQGKTVLIDIWASWCKDCIAGFPDLQKLQKDNPDMNYVFLSLDKDTERWKAGIEKYNLQGSHYFIKSGWKGPLCSSINLDWIPRYILLDKTGKIKVYKAITTKDNQLLNQIQ